MKVQARSLLTMDRETIWSTFNFPRYPVVVVFDDGELSTTGRELILSQYFWEYHRHFPTAPLLMAQHIPSKPRIHKRSSLDMISVCFWGVYDHLEGRVSLPELCKKAYDITNTIYNEIVLRLPEYITGISAVDFIDVLAHPEIKAANERAVPTQTSIARTGKIIQEVLTREGELVGNRPAEASKSGLVSAGQTNQIFGPRGFVTDIDSNVFRHPIMVGYAKGMKQLHDYAIESRSASKALFFAKDPLADVEYLNRQLQLLAASLRHLFKGDCGSDILLPLSINTSADLKTYEGKYYYGTDNKMYRILKEDKHLVGQQVFVRSPLGCHCLPKQGVCQACLGEISLQIPDGANLGHLSVIELCSGVSQNVLSTKHLDGSSQVEVFVIADGDASYLQLGKRDNVVNLNTALANRRPVLIVSQEAAFNLTELNHVKDLRNFPITRISDVEFVTIAMDDLAGKERCSVDVVVSVGTRHSSFTVEFLAYVKRHGWIANDSRGYEIDLSHWDFNKPIFELPMKNINTMEFMSDVADIIKFKRLKRKRNKRAKELAMNMTELAGLAMELHDTVNRRFTYNIAHCELILAVCLIRSAQDGDYRFPSPLEPREFAPFKELMDNRSMSVAYAFEKHAFTMLDLKSFLIKRRPSHPMDRIYVPED